MSTHTNEMKAFRLKGADQTSGRVPHPSGGQPMITTTIIPLNDGITFFINATRQSDDDGRPRELTMKVSITEKIPLAGILDHIENVMLGRIHAGWWELEPGSSRTETWKYHPHNHDIF